MDKDVALRIDGMLIGVRGCLDGLAYYMKDNVPSDEYATLILLVGSAMADTVELSSRLHATFPDITPKELASQRQP